MGNLPKLAIVGRPNVGKSALFNRLCQRRISIVDEAEGVTRDRLYAVADCFGKPYELIDTGGIDPRSKVPFGEEIRRQAQIAIEEADALILVVDGAVGLTELDREVAQILRRKNKPVTLAVNKVDDHAQMDRCLDFHSLGFSHLFGISASHGLNVADLLVTALRDVDWNKGGKEEEACVKVAVVGRTNVGKSTLVNYLLDEDRCVVSPIPGTTRDSVDIDLDVEGVRYRLIDTAGIRRKKAEQDVVDKFAAIRTEWAIDRADVCLLMLSSAEGMTGQEKRIANQIEAAGKGCILLFNKWDLVKGFRMEHCLKACRDEVPFLEHCPALFISAKEGRNIEKIFPEIDRVADEAKRRITTGELNRFLEKAIQAYHPPMLQGKRLRVYYGSQVAVSPPRFVLFVNRPELMVDSYLKYLINSFRKEFSFAGIPLTFSLRGKIDRHKIET